MFKHVEEYLQQSSSNGVENPFKIISNTHTREHY
jgi:hypothetical protein